jgi:hypothetical protein
MDQLKTKAWEDALKRLNECSVEKREHFAVLITTLADCYGTDAPAKAVVLVDRGEHMAMFSAGAEEMTAAEMVSRAHAAFTMSVMADAPPKEMFN